MNRRHTITTKPNNDYPEHLNPFSDEDDDNTNNNKSASSLGRRNSRLTASFRSINSWSIFSSKKSKKEDRKDNDSKPDKGKFMTMTPKHRSHILETIPAKSDRKPLNLNGTSEVTPRQTPTREPCEEFKLTPKSDRYRSHSMTSAAPVPVPERRVSPGQCPVPLPRRTIAQSERAVIENEVQSTSTERRPTLKIEEDDGKYIQQGARPKKKRRAPLPPTLAPPSTTTHATINNTESNASESGQIASDSEVTAADVHLCRTTTADSSQSTAIQRDGNDASSSTQPHAMPASRTPTDSSSQPIVVPSPRKAIAGTETSVDPSTISSTTRTDTPYMLPSSRTVTSGTESIAVVDLKDDPAARNERTAVPGPETTVAVAKPAVFPGPRTTTSRTENTTVVPVSRTITSRTEEVNVVPVSRIITSRTESPIVPSPRTVISRSEEKPVVLGYKRPITSRTTAVFGSTKASIKTEPVPVSRVTTTSTQLTSVPDTRTTLSNAESTTLGTTTTNEPVPSPKTVTSSINANEVTRPGTTATAHDYLKVVPESRNTEPPAVLNTPVDVVSREQPVLETATEEELEQKLLLDEKILIEKVEKLTNLIISS